ncbi:cache domain-containing protein [Cystobacter fuscus]
MSFSKSLATKLLVALCTIISLALSLLVLIVSRQSAQVAEEQANQLVTQMAERYARTVNSELDNAFIPVRTLAQTLAAQKVAGLTDRRLADVALRNVAEANPKLLGLWTTWEPNAFDGLDAKYVNTPGSDATGRYISNWSRGTGRINLEPNVDYETEGVGDYYLLARKSRRETIVNPYLYPVAGRPTLITSITVPILLDGKFVGTVGADISLEQIQKHISELTPFGTGYALLVSNNGAFVAHPSAERRAKPLGTSSADTLVKTALSSDSAFSGQVDSEVLGARAIEVVVPIRIGETVTPWALAVIAPLDKVLAPARELRQFTLGFGALALLALGGAVLLIIRRVTGPLETISSVATRIANGDLTGALDHRSEDEVGILADAFRSMRDRLAQVIGEVREGAAALSSAASQLSATSQSLASRASQQATTFEEMTTRLDGMSASIIKNADSSRRVETIASKGAADAQKSSRAVAETVEAMKQIASRISVIEEIAYQTNLLSLNAAIEAARAATTARGSPSSPPRSASSRRKPERREGDQLGGLRQREDRRAVRPASPRARPVHRHHVAAGEGGRRHVERAVVGRRADQQGDARAERCDAAERGGRRGAVEHRGGDGGASGEPAPPGELLPPGRGRGPWPRARPSRSAGSRAHASRSRAAARRHRGGAARPPRLRLLPRAGLACQ